MSRSVFPDCPHCRNSKVITINRGRKSAVMLGGLAGGISSAATVWNGARLGAAVGAIAGPSGALLSAVAGAVLAALAGGAAGCAAGAVVGDLIDDKVLDNYRCLSCDHRFSCSTMTVEDVSSPQPHHAPSHLTHPHFYPHEPAHSSEEPDEEHQHPYGYYHPYPYPFHPAAHG